MPDGLLTTVKKALALIWRDDQCAVPPGWTTEQDGMVCHAFRSVIRDDRGTVLAEARNGTATAIVTVMNNVNALLARCEAAEDEVERLNSPVLKSDWQQMVAERDAARAEAETERMRLVACGVAAMQNTEAAATERIGRDNPCWSASYGDVCAAVDREMAHRAEAARLREARADDVALVARLSQQVVALRDAVTRVLDGPHYIDRDYQDVLLAALDTPEREGGRGDDSDCV